MHLFCSLHAGTVLCRVQYCRVGMYIIARWAQKKFNSCEFPIGPAQSRARIDIHTYMVLYIHTHTVPLPALYLLYTYLVLYMEGVWSTLLGYLPTYCTLYEYLPTYVTSCTARATSVCQLHVVAGCMDHHWGGGGGCSARHDDRWIGRYLGRRRYLPTPAAQRSRKR